MRSPGCTASPWTGATGSLQDATGIHVTPGPSLAARVAAELAKIEAGGCLTPTRQAPTPRPPRASRVRMEVCCDRASTWPREHWRQVGHNGKVPDHLLVDGALRGQLAAYFSSAPGLRRNSQSVCMSREDATPKAAPRDRRTSTLSQPRLARSALNCGAVRRMNSLGD